MTSLGHQKMRVEFTRVAPTREGDACCYDVHVEGVLIGYLYREYSRGVRAPRGCIGGFRGGYDWFFMDEESMERALDRRPFFVSDWRKLAEAKDAIVKAFNAPMANTGLAEFYGDDLVNMIAWIEQHKGPS